MASRGSWLGNVQDILIIGASSGAIVSGSRRILANIILVSIRRTAEINAQRGLIEVGPKKARLGRLKVYFCVSLLLS